jgi:hypothetical protein
VYFRFIHLHGARPQGFLPQQGIVDKALESLAMTDLFSTSLYHGCIASSSPASLCRSHDLKG